MKIDGIDKIIINKLIEDARTPVLSIAREVGISGAAIHQRLKKLEKTNLIEGYHMVVNSNSLGYTTTAFIGVFTESTSPISETIKRLKEIPQIIETHYITGNFNIFIKVLCKSNKSLMRILNEEVLPIKGILRTETFISLEQQIKRQIKI